MFEIGETAIGFAVVNFLMYPGKWEVRQLPSLLKARKFWLQAIAGLSPKQFEENAGTDSWKGFIQKFWV